MASSAFRISASSYRISSKQHPHGHKAQPEPCLPQRPGVGQHHGSAGQQPHLRPGPAAAAELQGRHHRQHGHRALRGHTPAAEQRVAACQHHATHQGRRGRRYRHAQPGRTPPQQPHQGSGQPGKQGDVQARNAHQVRHARGAEDVPICPVNGPLVARDQGGHHPGHALGGCLFVYRSAAGQALKDGVAYRLAPLLHRVLPGGTQPLGGLIFRASAHIARGLHALLPQPQFVVKAVRVAQPVGRFQAHGHAPAFSCAQLGRLALQIDQALGVTQHAAVPGHINQRRHLGRRARALGGAGAARIGRGIRPIGRLHLQAQAHPGLGALGHGCHHGSDAHVLPFHRRRQALPGKPTGSQATQGKGGNRRPGQRGHPPPGPPPAPPRNVLTQPAPAQRWVAQHAGSHHAHRRQGTAVRPHRPQLGLPQLQRGARQYTAQHGRQRPQSANTAIAPMHTRRWTSALPAPWAGSRRVAIRGAYAKHGLMLMRRCNAPGTADAAPAV